MALSSSQLADGVIVVGAASHPLRDAYHSILRMSWPAALGAIALLFLLANAVFGVLFTLTGGVSGAHDGSFRDSFFFSVQTMGTVGYGAMYPTSNAANLLVVLESVFGVILTALATGIVFARFSRTRGRVIFTSQICIAPMDGVPTLTLRVANDAASTIFDTAIRLVLTKTSKTKEGVTFYRLADLKLTRDRALALSRSWTIIHVIDEASPLFGLTPEDCTTDEVEIMASVVGTDDTSLQPVHGRQRWEAKDIAWGYRLADVLSELPDGRLQLDVRRFDVIVATQPSEGFPYPRAT